MFLYQNSMENIQTYYVVKIPTNRQKNLLKHQSFVG